MEYAIQTLVNQKEVSIEELKKNENIEANHKRLAELKNAICWLQKLSELNIKSLNRYDIVELPYMETGYSEFRLMNDCESDDRKNWIEWKDHPTITAGDFIISKKP